MPSFAERRAANIQANNAELAKINAVKKLKVPKASSAAESTRRASSGASRVKREPAPKETLRPTRQSSRLAGINADDNVLKRKVEVELEAENEKARQKKMRVNDDMALGEISIDGKKWEGGFSEMKKLGLGIPARGAQPGVKTFTEEDVKDTTDKGLKDLRLRMGSLKLYEKFPVGGKFSPFSCSGAKFLGCCPRFSSNLVSGPNLILLRH
jgi:hypothetical protein